MDEKEIIMDEKVVKEIAEFYEIPESEVSSGMYSMWEYQHSGNQAAVMGFGIGTKHTFNNHEFTVKEVINAHELAKKYGKAAGCIYYNVGYDAENECPYFAVLGVCWTDEELKQYDDLNWSLEEPKLRVDRRRSFFAYNV